jgi:hypothetical protein
MCEVEGRVTPATVADHIVPHKGNVTLFVTGELQSLCQSCHSTVKQSEERHGYSKRVDPLTGWPVDVRHPANKEWKMANEPITEREGSSAQTAIAVGVGSVVGATVLVAAAPVVLPIIGLGAVAAAITPVVGGVIGGWMGWGLGGKKWSPS